MKLTFIGAAHEVTGSCHLLEVNGKHILIDCGMEQGPDLYENQEIPVAVGEIDYVLLTHAHIDHSGLIPLLAKRGFQGQIVTTFATADLCQIMLRDSAHIQELRLSGEIERREDLVQNFMSHCTRWKMLSMHCNILYRAITIRKLSFARVYGYGLQMWDICSALRVSKFGCVKTMWRRRLYFRGMSEISISRSSKIQRLCVKRIM